MTSAKALSAKSKPMPGGGGRAHRDALHHDGGGYNSSLRFSARRSRPSTALRAPRTSGLRENMLLQQKSKVMSHYIGVGLSPPEVSYRMLACALLRNQATRPADNVGDVKKRTLYHEEGIARCWLSKLLAQNRAGGGRPISRIHFEKA